MDVVSYSDKVEGLRVLLLRLKGSRRLNGEPGFQSSAISEFLLAHCSVSTMAKLLAASASGCLTSQFNRSSLRPVRRERHGLFEFGLLAHLET